MITLIVASAVLSKREIYFDFTPDQFSDMVLMHRIAKSKGLNSVNIGLNTMMLGCDGPKADIFWAECERDFGLRLEIRSNRRWLASNFQRFGIPTDLVKVNSEADKGPPILLRKAMKACFMSNILVSSDQYISGSYYMRPWLDEHFRYMTCVQGHLKVVRDGKPVTITFSYLPVWTKNIGSLHRQMR